MTTYTAYPQTDRPTRTDVYPAGCVAAQVAAVSNRARRWSAAARSGYRVSSDWPQPAQLPVTAQADGLPDTAMAYAPVAFTIR